jgi:hypothetical protein
VQISNSNSLYPNIIGWSELRGSWDIGTSEGEVRDVGGVDESSVAVCQIKAVGE